MLTPKKVDGNPILRWLQKGCQAAGPVWPVLLASKLALVVRISAVLFGLNQVGGVA